METSEQQQQSQLVFTHINGNFAAIARVGTAGGRIELATPKIPLDNLSSYHWYNELKVAADNARP